MANSGVNFFALQTDYIAELNVLVTFTETWATEVENARQGKVTLLSNISAKVDKAGLDANLPALGFRITGAGNAVNPGDYTTLSQVNSIVTMGGNPNDVAITDLNIGNLAPRQLLQSDGTNLVATPAATVRYLYQ